MALEPEVGGVVFLDVPAIVRVLDVVAPAHSSGVVNGVTEAAKVHVDVVEHVRSTPAPAHERRFVGAPG